MKWGNGKKVLNVPISPVIAVSAVIVIAIGAITFATRNNNGTPAASLTPTSSATVYPTGTNTPDPFAATPVASTDPGPKDLTLLSDLKLYVVPADSGDGTITYYGAGTISSGTYAGYSRVLAVCSNNGPVAPTVTTFATKDNKTYTLDSPVTTKPTPLCADSYSSKVVGTANVGTSLPVDISLDDTYSLHQDQPALGSNLNETTFLTDFTGYTPLTTLNGVKLYANTLNPYAPDPSATPDPTYATINHYFAGSTQILAVDSLGVAFIYDLVNKASLDKYYSDLPAYETAITKFDADTTGDLPYPTINNPDLGFTTTAISGVNLYSTYGFIKENACSHDVNTYVTKNISASDLTAIGTENGMTVYLPKDSSNPLLHWIYTENMGIYDVPDYKPIDPSGAKVSVPTESQYLAKNPLLFIKDPWGRYDMLAENYYQIDGGPGCGKPVVYLYPTTPTKVHVEFTGKINLTTDIPTYHNGWDVLAQPNGTLTDLQPQFTKCASFSKPAFGSEYATTACAGKTYPYLYWAGNSTNAPYPIHTDGWVVSKADLSNFLNKTLDSAGLTSTEKNDMLSYWVPELSQKNAPYYKIDFLQTAEMNQIAPMKVTPTPASTFRIFLDWTPLQSMPTQLPKPEVLSKVQRNGFTLVEWGGLKR